MFMANPLTLVMNILYTNTHIYTLRNTSNDQEEERAEKSSGLYKSINT